MRKLALLLFLAQSVVTVPPCEAKPVTVGQLTRLVRSVSGKPDAKAAQTLSGLELTERLNAESLPALEQNLPGVESRRALVLLADLSAFLPPPAAEVPATEPPDLQTQRQVMARVVDYAAKAIHQLPNFIATRDTIRFEDSPAEQTIFGSVFPHKPLHAVQSYRSDVYFRDGNEVEDATSMSGKTSGPPTRGLITSGEFGPIISTVLMDAAQGQVAWSRWEMGKTGPIAIFRYRIPREESHYQVRFCCVTGEGANGVVERFTGYHGELAADPSSGAISRITLRADLEPSQKIVRADILVQYGPVEIGGQTYICPAKSISISVAPFSSTTYLRDANRFAPVALDQGPDRVQQTLLNDVVFDNYHVFRSETRVVTGNSTSKPGDSAASPPENPIPTTGTPEDATAPASSGSSSPSTVASDSADRPQDSSSAATGSSNAAASTSEISERTASGLPEASDTASPALNGEYSLRVTTRLVDVGVVALDRKGRPLTGLKPEDFEIYDNGRKQEVRFFSSPANLDQSSPDPQPTLSGEIAYSNRRADIENASASVAASDRSVTILLIDSNSLGWQDLTYARQQMLRFLQTMPPNERVGIYVQDARGFQVLAELTTDRFKLASALREWKPAARDLAGAQEAEQRNRQQFDDVGHAETLQSVNGNINTSPDSAAAVDPQLRDFGSISNARALATLVLVARHFTTLPGRKNLVWVTSENVLSDWADRAVRSDFSGKPFDEAVLRAEEALNDAHASVYPIDASQLETQSVNPSLENHNVVLSPRVTAPPGPQSGGAAPGRIVAEMQQNVRPVQQSIQAMANATGGRVFRRGGDLAANLNSVFEDGRASYLLGFVPNTPSDDQYHALTVKLVSRRGVQLRYRAGYLYSREPATPKDRFLRAAWQVADANDIAISARQLPAFGGSALKINIAVNDLALQFKNGRWDGKLDIFAVQLARDDRQAQFSERQLILSLLPETYRRLMQTGIPFDQFIERKPGTASIRVIVVDEGSGRIGSLTFPAEALKTR